MEAEVLVIDDDPVVADLVSELLRNEGYRVRWAATGAEGLALARQSRFDLYVLDIRLPDIDGHAVCRTLREWTRAPILMLSGLGDNVDEIIGMEVGADDFVAKPFQSRVLMARVRAHLRRWCQWHREVDVRSQIDFGPFRLRRDEKSLSCGNQQLRLTWTEFSLLAQLLDSPKRVFSRQELLDGVWGSAAAVHERNVDTHVRNLRAKLRAHSPRDWIVSARGAGYRFEP